jgi:hypothetical protein
LASASFFLGLGQVRFTALDLDPIYVRKNHLPERFKNILKLRARNLVVRGDEDRQSKIKKLKADRPKWKSPFMFNTAGYDVVFEISRFVLQQAVYTAPAVWTFGEGNGGEILRFFAIRDFLLVSEIRSV